jgi:glycosyltransferase involved in cell wall biosynthesis
MPAAIDGYSEPCHRELSIGFPYVADRFGGSTVSSMILARSLADNGYRVHILAHGDGRLIDEASAKGFEVIPLPTLPSLSKTSRSDRFLSVNMLAFATCSRAIRRLALDIVHVNDFVMLRTWALPARSTGAKLVVHWRNTYSDSWSISACLRLAHVVVAVSEYSKNTLPPWVQSKTIVEYNPFGVFYDRSQRSAARAEIRSRMAVPGTAAVIGIFGNHSVRKRTHILADILNRVHTTADGRPVYGLACGGRIEPYDMLLDEKVAAFQLGQRLFRPGFVRPVEDWMAACDLILAPAEREPLARNVLEAQGVGVPVIVSSDGGLREIMTDGETGIVLDPFKIDDWIAGVRSVLDQKEFAERLSTQAQRQLERLSPHEHACRIAKIYAGLTKR